MEAFPDKQHKVHSVLEQYVRIHNEIFNFSWRKVIPVPGIFKSVNYEKHASDLSCLVGNIEKMSLQEQKNLPTIFPEYVRALCDAISALRDICKKLHDQSQKVGSYPPSQYKRDVERYNLLAANYRNLGNRLNQYVRNSSTDTSAGEFDHIVWETSTLAMVAIVPFVTRFPQYEAILESNLIKEWDRLSTIAMTGVAAHTRGILLSPQAREELKRALDKWRQGGAEGFEDYYGYSKLRTAMIGAPWSGVSALWLAENLRLHRNANEELKRNAEKLDFINPLAAFMNMSFGSTEAGLPQHLGMMLLEVEKGMGIDMGFGTRGTTKNSTKKLQVLAKIFESFAANTVELIAERRESMIYKLGDSDRIARVRAIMEKFIEAFIMTLGKLDREDPSQGKRSLLYIFGAVDMLCQVNGIDEKSTLDLFENMLKEELGEYNDEEAQAITSAVIQRSAETEGQRMMKEGAEALRAWLIESDIGK